MVADTRKWLPGRKVLVSPPWATAVNWAEALAPIDRDYESALHD